MFLFFLAMHSFNAFMLCQQVQYVIKYINERENEIGIFNVEYKGKHCLTS